MESVHLPTGRSTLGHRDKAGGMMGKDQEGEEDRQTEDRQGTGHRHNVGVGFTDKDNKGGMRTERDNNEGTVPAGVSLNASEGTGEKEEEGHE